MEVCKACVMLEGLNKGLPRLGIGKSSKALQHIDAAKDASPKRIDF
jgi:cytoplasmic tRNA 2-thiolation protein 1